MMKLIKTTAGLLLVTVLAACGGGRGDEAAAESPAADDRKVPSSALASASAFSQWAGSLATSDTAEAVVVDAGMAAPQSETEAPIGLR